MKTQTSQKRQAPQTSGHTLQADSETSSVPIQDVYLEHQSRQHGMALCKKIIDLIIEIQKHRGCTLAILSGDHFFETQLFSIQRDITADFREFEALRREFLNLGETQQIMQEWICIRRLWRKDSVQENFLLHSNLVGELIKMIWLVVQRSNQLGIRDKQDQLLELCFRDGLNMIETCAQIRGLTTHITVSQIPNPELQSRIRFLSEELQSLKARFKELTTELDETQAYLIKATYKHSDFESYLSEFESAIEKEFLDRELPKIDTDTIYTLASNVITASYQVLLFCIKLLEKSLSPELEAWVQGGNKPDYSADES